MLTFERPLPLVDGFSGLGRQAGGCPWNLLPPICLLLSWHSGKETQSALPLHILVSMVNILNSNPIPVRIEQNVAKFCFVNSNVYKKILIVDKGRKAKSNFLQNAFKRSMVSHAYLSSQTHTACVVWCGIGREELTLYHS